MVVARIDRKTQPPAARFCQVKPPLLLWSSGTTKSRPSSTVDLNNVRVISGLELLVPHGPVTLAMLESMIKSPKIDKSGHSKDQKRPASQGASKGKSSTTRQSAKADDNDKRLFECQLCHHFTETRDQMVEHIQIHRVPRLRSFRTRSST